MVTTTDADRRRWQRKALHALDTLLELDLPPLDWAVGTVGTLSAQVDTNDGAAHARAVLDAWARALGSPVGETSLGTSTLLQVTAHHAATRVYLSARLYL